MFDLYLITPELDPAAILTRTAAALAGAPPGRAAVQLRAKHLDRARVQALGRALRQITRDAGALLIASADPALARELDADGVQLPELGPRVERARAELPRPALIGASRHDAAGLATAARAGADFATLSPVFASPGKGEPLGTARFAELARDARLDVIALGGVTAERTPELIASGAHGVAVIREVYDAADPARATARLIAALDAARTARRV